VLTLFETVRFGHSRIPPSAILLVGPQVIPNLAKGRARACVSDLAEACDGRFTEHHARLARLLLDQLDDLGGRIDAVTALLDKAVSELPATPLESTQQAVDPTCASSRSGDREGRWTSPGSSEILGSTVTELLWHPEPRHPGPTRHPSSGEGERVNFTLSPAVHALAHRL